jgi:PAS domain S-box-containing protein
MPDRAATVLVVDDNLIMRRLVRAALQPEGYRVVEADSGAAALEALQRGQVDLVLQDMLLPDVDGAVLVQRLRHALAGRPVPIIALSGFEARLLQARALQGGFDDYLFKPVPPSLLVQVVAQHLVAAPAETAPSGRPLVLLADDDAIQRRLVEIQLSRAGFDVATAEDGLDALEQARRKPPAAIVSDVLMPRMDGFNLCHAVRKDAKLAAVPVVLTSNAYVEAEDRALAEKAGANTLILRTPDSKTLVDELRRCIEQGAPKPQAAEDLPVQAYTQRALQQLERQAGLNLRLADRVSALEAQVAVLAELYSALQEQSAPAAVIHKILTCGLDAFGTSQGLAILFEGAAGLRLALSMDYPRKVVARLDALFADASLAHAFAPLREPVAVPGEGLEPRLAGDILAAIDAKTLLLTPLVSGADSLGFFLVPLEELREGADWTAFARAVGASVGQAIRLARSLEATARTEQMYRTIVDTANEGIAVIDTEGRLKFVNPRFQEMFGCTAEELAGRPFLETVAPDQREAVDRGYRERLARGGRGQNEVRGVRKDGSPLWLLASVTSTLDEAGEVNGLVSMLSDVTARKQAEDELRSLSRELEARVESRTHELSLATDVAEAERAMLTAVMANMSDGLLVVAEDRGVRYCNRRAAELLGDEQRDFAGQPLAAVEDCLRQQLGGQALPTEWEAGLRQPAAGAVFELSLSPPRRDVQLQFFAATAPNEAPSVGLLLRDVTTERNLARTKDELVSVVSHELRTPLASVVGFTELLLEGEHDQDEQRLYLSTIGEEGRRLTALINDFLDLERMSSGRQEYKKAAVDVEAALAQALAAAGDDPRHPNVLRLAELPPVWADRDSLQQVLTNLISNARKYSPAGGEVRIAAELRDGEVEISVADQGLGLPADAMPRLFTAFYRVDNSDRRAIKGTGLGLSITRRIVEDHGGRVWAESEGEGHGSRFAFTLPLAAQVEA